MDASLQQQLTLAAVGMSGAALFFSLLAAFPGLKSVLAAVRDGVLWFSLFMVLGAGGFLVWQSARQPAIHLAADSAPQAAQ
jgi:predicted small integral membrane protein